MPVAQRDVVEVFNRQPVNRDRVGGPDTVTVLVDLKHAAEHRCAAVGDHDPRDLADGREVEAADPGGRVVGMMPPKQRASR